MLAHLDPCHSHLPSLHQSPRPTITSVHSPAICPFPPPPPPLPQSVLAAIIPLLISPVPLYFTFFTIGFRGLPHTTALFPCPSLLHHYSLSTPSCTDIIGFQLPSTQLVERRCPRHVGLTLCHLISFTWTGGQPTRQPVPLCCNELIFLACWNVTSSYEENTKRSAWVKLDGGQPL